MKLALLLEPDRVLLDLRARTREEVLVAVAEQLERNAAVRCADDVVDLLLDRERLGATVIGDEVAVPHCKIPGLREIVAAFARTVEPVPYAADDATVRLFFFVLSPREQPAAHLQVLANIARLLRSPQARQVLNEATDPAALLAGLARLEAGT